MTSSNWITLIGILIAAFVALAIAHMQRKQMRQIELHRSNPTVPLRPPLHPVTRFVRGYGYFVVFFIYNVVIVIVDRRQTTPLTREDVYDLAFHMIGVVVMIFLAMATFAGEVAAMATKMTISTLEDIDRVIGHLVERIEKLEQRKK